MAGSDSIKYSDLVQEGAFEKIIAEGQKLFQVFEDLDKVFIKVGTDLKGALSVSPKNLGDIESLKASIQKAKELSAAHDKLKDAKGRLTLETAKAKQELNNYNTIVRNTAKDELGMISAYQKESIVLNDLRKQYKDLVLQKKHVTTEGKALLNNITQLDSKLKAVDATVGQHQRNVGNYASSLSDMKTGIVEIAGALGVAFGIHQVVDFGKESVKAFLEAEKNAKDLQNALHGNTAVFNTLIKQSAELQEKSIFSDDDVQQAQKALAVYGLTGDQIEKITPQVVDLASKLGIDLASATDKTISAINGQTKGLKEAGIAFKDTGSKTENFNILTEKLTKFQGASAEALETTIGKAQRLKNAFGDFQEVIGEMIVNEGANLLDFFEGLSTGMDEVIAKRASSDLVKTLNEGNAKILEDAKKSESERLRLIKETENGITEIAEQGLKTKDLTQKRILASALKNQQQLLSDLKHLNDKQEIEDDATNAAKLEKTEDFEKKLRDLRTGNKDNEYEREKQIIRDHHMDEEKKYEGHAEILVELRIKLRKDLDAIDEKWNAAEKKKSEKHNDELQAYDMKNLQYDLKAEKAKEQKEEDEARAKRQKEINDEIELTERLVKAYDERYQKIADIKRDQIDSEIDSAESNMEIQAQLAARGLDNTLAYEMEKKAELERARAEQIEAEKKHAKQMEAAELGLAFIQAYQNYIEKDMPAGQALSRAAADIFAAKIFSTAIAGSFAEGVEDFKGKGTGTSDSNIIEFSNGESVVTAKGTQETPGLVTALNEAGYAGAVSWAMDNIYSEGMVLSDRSKSSQSDQAITMLLAKKIDQLTQVVKDKPVSNSSIDGLGNTITTLLQNGNKYTHTKKRHLI